LGSFGVGVGGLSPPDATTAITAAAANADSAATATRPEGVRRRLPNRAVGPVAFSGAPPGTIIVGRSSRT
jgi:hypothetical protein